MRLTHRPLRARPEPGTFVFRPDGPVVLVIAEVRRTDLSDVLSVIWPAWAIVPRRMPPEYERPSFAMRRLGAEAALLLYVPFARGDTVDVLLAEVPETVLNEIWRAAEEHARKERPR